MEDSADSKKRKAAPSIEGVQAAGAALGKPVDLSYLGKNFSQHTQTTEQGEKEVAAVKPPSDSEVELYDVEMAKKRIIVMALERIQLALTSKYVAVNVKAELGLRAMAQFEGTRKVIEWDKRIPDQKGLLDKADILGKKLVEMKKKLSDKEMRNLEMKAVEALVGGSEILSDKEKN